MDMTGMKHEIEALAEAHREEFEAVSACIFEHPELAFQEKTAQNELCSLLERHGFSVKRGAGSLDTAFVAEYNSGKPGMTFAFLCEYDALPELGHACGHNLIGTSGAGAGVVLKEIMEKYGMDQMEASRAFLTSETHAMLEDAALAMTDFSDRAVFDMWEAERVTGDPRNSTYLRSEI